MFVFKRIRICLFVMFVILWLDLGPIKMSDAYWMWTPETGKWINPKWAVKSTPEDQFIWAMEKYDAHDYKRASKEFANLAVYYPFSEYAPEAQFLTGESFKKMGEFYQAHLEYQKLVDNFPSSQKINEMLERQFQIANHFFYSKGPRWKAYIPLLPTTNNYEIALEIYLKIIKNAPFGDFADDAQYKVGDTYLKLGDFTKAIHSYEKLIAVFPDSEFSELASYKIAVSKSQGLYGKEGAFNAAPDALEDFEAFSKEYPDSRLIEEAKIEIDFLRRENAQKLYEIALFYEKNKGLKAAEFYYLKVVRDYEGTVWSKEAAMRLKKIGPKLEKIKKKENK